MAHSVTSNRRRVSGVAFKVCDFCGRDHVDKEGVHFNYQYFNESKGQFNTEVFCSKVCSSAWRTTNNR